jgi:transketolase
MTAPFCPRRLRRTILRMAFAGSTVHVGCAFSIVELLAVLYRAHLRFDRRDPRWPGRDYLVLSKGHGVMAQYACLYELGWLTDDQLDRYFGDGTALKGLSDAHVPGLEVTSGSLGHGLPVGVGLAYAARRLGTGQRCFALAGDGEMNEGTMWEALLFARQQRLANLTLIVDANGFQAMGRTDEVLDLEPLADKLRAFGLETREVDGHDERAIDAALAELGRHPSPGPRAVVARTTKGKGVSFMEGDNAWHYTRLTRETYGAALAELDAA